MAPENKDADFTWAEFQAKNNNELVSIYGNFINRVIVLINKYWEGKIPTQNQLDSYDKDVLKKIDFIEEKISNSIEKFKFRDSLSELINLARIGNKYLADKEPWKLKSTDERATQTIMNIAAQIAGSLAILSEPFLPFSSQKLKEMMNITHLSWQNNSATIFVEGHQINKASHLFNKIEDEKIKEQIEKLSA
jgi:methionyl-tRNA synthetase